MTAILKNEKGMTLMEIMIVLLIIGGSATMFFSKIQNSNNKIKEAVRQFGVLTRDLHSKAKLSNSTYRLVIDMGEGKFHKDKHRYWVESASGSRISSKSSSISEYNKLKLKDDKQPKRDDGFSPDSRLGKPRQLPGGIFFEDIELKHLDKTIDSGVVYIHFRPEGFVDEAAIHLKYDDNLRWTVSIHPLTGKAYISTEYRSLKDISPK